MNKLIYKHTELLAYWKQYELAELRLKNHINFMSQNKLTPPTECRICGETDHPFFKCPNKENDYTNAIVCHFYMGEGHKKSRMRRVFESERTQISWKICR